MILSAVTVLELNERYNLIEGLCERELNNPEGICLDLRVGQIHEIVGDSLLGIEDRYSPKIKTLKDVLENEGEKFTIKPGEYYLVTTMESVSSPAEKIKYHPDFPEGYLVPKIQPRVSLQKGGVALHCTGTNPGFHGPLTFGISNQGKYNFIFEMGARMFSVEYHSVIGEMKRAYSGQHQDGRVTSEGEIETQN